MISPVPSGFVRKSASPGRAPFFGQIPSGRTVPTTASPYFGSASRIVWPPASSPPAARTCWSAAAKISASISIGSSSGKAAIESASSGVPPIAQTSFNPLVVQPVDGRIVGRREPDEQVLGLGRDETSEQLLEARGRVLGGAAPAGSEVGELYGAGVQ